VQVVIVLGIVAGLCKLSLFLALLQVCASCHCSGHCSIVLCCYAVSLLRSCVCVCRMISQIYRLLVFTYFFPFNSTVHIDIQYVEVSRMSSDWLVFHINTGRFLLQNHYFLNRDVVSNQCGF